MFFFIILGLMVTHSAQETAANRCDELSTKRFYTQCTSCAASPGMLCPSGSRKITTDMGIKGCSYGVEIGDGWVFPIGCRHSCETQVMVRKCCSNFWGPLCLPCPSVSDRMCNWLGSCMDGMTGNGTCICNEGVTGFACEHCKKQDVYGSQCASECTCSNKGQCNSGPNGDGQCYCQPPYTGSKCQEVSQSCANCTGYSYCKGNGASATCECLPGFKRTGTTCSGDVCSTNVCHPNAECMNLDGRNYQCTCKDGYQGDGKLCTPINPCDMNNGGCPTNSTNCVYVSPAKSRCECKSGTEGSSPSQGCRPKKGCDGSTCHSTAKCQIGADAIPICSCAKEQIGNGRRCYGNIMERILELDRGETLKGKLSASIATFENGCQLILTKHGPFTVFIPLLSLSPTQDVPDAVFCKNHIILGQYLMSELQSKEYWLLSGKSINFQNNKKFTIAQASFQDFSVVHSDIPAANGIIHIIDKPIIKSYPNRNIDEKYAKMNIGSIVASENDFNRFQSLVDNCGADIPLKGPGPLTVFVPTNEAIDRARDGSFIYMLSQAKDKLQKLLKHHIFSMAAVTVEQLATMTEFQTMAHETITVNIAKNARIFLTEKKINLDYREIVASNGIIHVIDGVFIPPSIVPILPHRCDKNESQILEGSCTRCSHLNETHCPSGSTELTSYRRDCEYSTSPDFLMLSSGGCAKYCNTTRVQPDCCPGFYGPDCKPCIGGFETPCYGKGTCDDGINGDGSCKCIPGFTGIACHLCSDPKKHGENCNEDCRCVHGNCDNRPNSNGVCRAGSCQEGYHGDFCEQELTQCSATCHPNGYCHRFENGTSSCICEPGFDGDGYSCLPSNPCLKPDRGGCNLNAKCVHAGPGNTSCICNEGWMGDGLVCTEINNCLLNDRGGCHLQADCKPTGPGQNKCTCKSGYMGDGRRCDLINPCRTNNGGCHNLAACKLQSNGTAVCTCSPGFSGNGKVCYGDLFMELVLRTEFSHFYSLIQKSTDFDTLENVTALVPSYRAFRSLSKAEADFWLDPFRLPFFLKVHFLDGVFTLEDMEQRVNTKLSTLNEKTKWEIKNKSGEIMVENATIVAPDIKATNGFIHIIDTVLRPPLSDIPPDPPGLMEFFNSTPEFSLFQQAIVFYNLTNVIHEKKYTILIPTNEAIKQYFNSTNVTQMDLDLVKYHVIVNAVLTPMDLKNGLMKATLLGSTYEMMFHANDQGEIFANDVLLNGNFNATKDGIVTGILHVLEIHKNYCNKVVSIKTKGKCGACEEKPKCAFFKDKPLDIKFPSNMKPNCKYTSRGAFKRISIAGCIMECLKTTVDHSCCSGYFGPMCLKCPGKVEKWCSNHGKCLDGLHGSGKCECDEGFNGTACETCKPGRYGPDCKSVCQCDHGRCQDGISGDGRCLCHKGWKGPSCSVEIKNDECGGTCHQFANCITGVPGTAPTCSCIAGYQGNGTSCKEINPCDSNNGGCSEFANCTKTSPGERLCKCQTGYTGDGLVCLEVDPCSEYNGGCHEKADCVKTGPGQAACICKMGYSGNGRYCYPVNPCRTANGGCDRNAWCEYSGPGERTCKCRINFIGDGLTCKGSIFYEIMHHPVASWFNRKLTLSKLNELSGSGPFTVFVPSGYFSDNFTAAWDNASRTADLLRYHIVSCEQLDVSSLKSIDKVVAVSGHQLTFNVREDVVYINNKTKIITSDYITANGIIHFIDNVLIPYDLQNKSTLPSSSLNITAAAEAYGYHIFSKLLQDAGLMSMIENQIHHPFTMLWPSDEVFNSFPEERKLWLYSADHKDKLAAYLKAHIIRGTKLKAVNLPSDDSVRTMYGSTVTFSCDRQLVGGIVVDNGNAKIISRNLEFDVGIAHGIDELLEPPDLGARCDAFKETKVQGRCGTCMFIPSCPYGFTFLSNTKTCMYNRYSTLPMYSRYRYNRLSYDIYHRLNSRRQTGCSRECGKSDWTPQCCKNHYGRNCQVCAGGLEAPCGNHGACDDGWQGTGNCTCDAGFRGTACELCIPNHYGPDCRECACTVHGECQDGMQGSGSCFCRQGWTGAHCEVEMEVIPVCTPECHPNAVCQPHNTCQCDLLYEGDGWNCTAPDLCSDHNGGCHMYANCTQTGVNVSCSCRSGYTGDGVFCSAINRCLMEENGGCSEFATCIFTGPNERNCECLPGFVGNGIQCLEQMVPPVDRCLEDNGDCDPKADCKDLHFHENTAGVFHLRSPAGKYKLNYTEAKAACEDEGAALATLSQLSAAQQLGMHLCMAGWMNGTQIGYPITSPSTKCGDNHVGIVLYSNPTATSKYDAYCYRMKDVSCKCGSQYIGDGYNCNGDLASVVATNANFSTFYSILLNYSDSAEGQDVLTLLSANGSPVTLFVPHNSGFYNETLSLRDLEYHISANNSIHFYNDLKHNDIIASQLGYNLTVVVSSFTASQDTKLVNERLIVDWDILAINGIIHVLDRPLKAPPPPVLPQVAPASPYTSKKAILASVFTICLVVLIAGLGYYIFKQKNDPFRFQYFKDYAEDDTAAGGDCSPTLMSIPNPLYSGQNAFLEPFDVSEDTEFH
nr:stabilin-1-like [Paramormyrops kingsleyae]